MASISVDNEDVEEQATSRKSKVPEVCCKTSRNGVIIIAPRTATFAASFLAVTGGTPLRFPPPGVGVGRSSNADAVELFKGVVQGLDVEASMPS
jgi:hypothetical protein